MLNKLNEFLTTFLIAPGHAKLRPENTLQLAIAVLLIEVMRADGSTDEERDTVLKILKERFRLPDAEVTQLMERGLITAKAANDFQKFTSLLNRELGMPEKIQILEYMWQVAYTDKHISAYENHLMHKIAGLLYISHADYIAAKIRAKAARVE